MGAYSGYVESPSPLAVLTLMLDQMFNNDSIDDGDPLQQFVNSFATATDYTIDNGQVRWINSIEKLLDDDSADLINDDKMLYLWERFSMGK